MFKKKTNQIKNEYKKNFNTHEHLYKTNNSGEETFLNNKSCCVINKKNIIFQEFLCHLPMSILALSISLFLLIFFDGFFNALLTLNIKKNIYLNLFHISHYIHILLASFASFYSFKNSLTGEKKTLLGIFLAIINSFFFCTLADAILPIIGALLLDNSINIHFCFLHFHDMFNAIFFAIAGIFASYCLMNGNKEYAKKIAKKVHLGHVWFGCIAALFYIFGQINIDIILYISFLFLLLFFSVVIPCILSDICIPYFFNIYISKNNNYQGLKIEYE